MEVTPFQHGGCKLLAGADIPEGNRFKAILRFFGDGNEGVALVDLVT